MVYCCVPQCKRSSEKFPELNWFTLPKDEKARRRWLALIRRLEWQPTPYARICSWHFPKGREHGPTRFDWNVEKTSEPATQERTSASRKGKAAVKKNISGEEDSSVNQLVSDKGDEQNSRREKLMLLTRKKQRKKLRDFSYGFKKGVSLVPPIRQTASIFKQPVTLVKSQDSKVQSDLVCGPQEKPRQLFWEKRLQGLRAYDIFEEMLDNVHLPDNVKGVGFDLSEETVLRSIAAALHYNGQPVTGQTRPLSVLEKNPVLYINPMQPLMQPLHVTEEDIQRQEDRVVEARKKLEKALNELHS